MHQVAADIHHFGFFSVGTASRPCGRQAKREPLDQGGPKKQSMVLDWDILKQKFSMRAGPEV